MEQKEYKIMLLNVIYGTTKEGKDYTRIGFVFKDKDKVLNSDKFCGVTEQSVFVTKDIKGYLDNGSIFRTFLLKGEMIPDYKNSLNARFKPLVLYDEVAKFEIVLSESI